MIKKYALKAPDALQLTKALELREMLQELGEPLVFVADDDELHEAAIKEGLEAVHPREADAVKKLQQFVRTKRR